MAYTPAARRKYATYVLDEISGVGTDKKSYETKRENDITSWIGGDDAKQREMQQENASFFKYSMYELTHIDQYVYDDNGSQRWFNFAGVPLRERITQHWDLPYSSFPYTEDTYDVNQLMPYYNATGPYGDATRSNKYHNSSTLFENTEITYTGTGDGVTPKFTSDGGTFKFVKEDIGEVYDGTLIFNGQRQWVINNTMKIWEAVNDLWETYIYGNQIISTGIHWDTHFTENELPNNPAPFIRIDPGYRGNLVNTDVVFNKQCGLPVISWHRERRYWGWYNGYGYYNNWYWNGYYDNYYWGSHWGGWYGYWYYTATPWYYGPLFRTCCQNYLNENAGGMSNRYTICGVADAQGNLIAWDVCKLFSPTETSTIQDHYTYHTRYVVSYSGWWWWSRRTVTPVTYKVYSHSTNTYRFHMDRVRCVTDGPKSWDYKVYPYVYFNNSLQIMCEVFNELKNQYIKCVEGIKEERAKITDDNYVAENSVMEIIDSILEWKNQSFRTFNDIKWFHDQVNNLWGNFHSRSMTLYSSIQNSSSIYMDEMRQIINNRLNKDDGTFWSWYKSACTTDLLYTAYLKHRFRIKMVLKKMAVYEFATPLADQPEIGSNVIQVKYLNELYNQVPNMPTLSQGLIVHIMDNTNFETECIIENVSLAVAEVTGDGNNDDQILVSSEGLVETKTINVYKITLDRVITNYDINNGAIMVVDLI